MLTTRILEGADWSERLQEPWQELASCASSATPFQTWEWQSLWFRHFSGGRRPHIWTLWEGNDLVGLFPMVKSVGLWRVLRAMGSGPSDYLHPISRPGEELRAAESLSGYLAGLPQTDLVDLHQVRETQELVRGANHGSGPWSTALAQATCLVLELPTSYEAYTARLSKSLRYDVRRLDKLASEDGRATIEAVPADRTSEGMAAFLDCHRRRWKKRGLPGAFVGKRSHRFHAEWADVAAKNDWLRISLLRFDGEITGAIYAMAKDDSCYFYQSGFDPAKGSISPGTLLVAHTIRQAIEEGRTKFDFMRGDEPYKRRWKPQHSYQNLRVLVAGNGWRGRTAMAWNGAGFRIESRVRARLEGRGLL